MPLKKDEKDLPLKITEIFKVGPKPIPSNNKDWDFLVYELILQNLFLNVIPNLP